MKKSLLSFILILKILIVFGQHKDYSNKKGFEILNGLLIKTNEIQIVPDSTITIFGLSPLTSKRFKIKSEIEVQVACYFTSGEFEKATGEYLIEIAEDVDGIIRKTFLDSIYNYWSNKRESYLVSHESLPADIHMFYEKGNYVLYSNSQINDGAYYLIYANEKIIKVSFKRFTQNKGWGGLSSFLSELVHFKFEKRVIKPKYKSYFNPKKFMKLYENNKFK